MDNYNKIINKNHAPNSLQISCLKDIVAGKDFELQSGFLIKNNTDEDLQVTIIPLDGEEEITTTIYIGWNPELVKKVINAPSGLQYGY